MLHKLYKPNFGKAKRLLIIQAANVISIPDINSQNFNLSEVMLRDETAWEEIYISSGNYSDVFERSRSGKYYNVSMSFMHPFVRQDAESVLKKLAPKPVYVAVTNHNNVSVLVGPLQMVYSSNFPESITQMSGFSISLTGKVLHKHFVNVDLINTVSDPWSIFFEEKTLLMRFSESKLLYIEFLANNNLASEYTQYLPMHIAALNGQVTSYPLTVSGTAYPIFPNVGDLFKINSINQNGFPVTMFKLDLLDTGINKINIPIAQNLVDIDLRGNNLDQESVNKLVYSLSKPNGVLKLENGTNAYPVGQAYYQKQFLINSLGWTITDNTPPEFIPDDNELGGI